MRNLVAFILISLSITSCHPKCVILKTDDAVFKSCYENRKLVSVERRNNKNVLTSIQYYSGESTLDSIFMCDSIGRFWSSCHYSNRVLTKQIDYWPNGLNKTFMKISSIDTVERAPDKVTGVIRYDYYFNGYMFVYRESGKLKEEGPIKKNEHTGIWIYYNEVGQIERRDTIK